MLDDDVLGVHFDNFSFNDFKPCALNLKNTESRYDDISKKAVFITILPSATRDLINGTHSLSHCVLHIKRSNYALILNTSGSLCWTLWVRKKPVDPFEKKPNNNSNKKQSMLLVPCCCSCGRYFCRYDGRTSFARD